MNPSATILQSKLLSIQSMPLIHPAYAAWRLSHDALHHRAVEQAVASLEPRRCSPPLGRLRLVSHSAAVKHSALEWCLVRYGCTRLDRAGASFVLLPLSSRNASRGHVGVSCCLAASTRWSLAGATALLEEAPSVVGTPKPCGLMSELRRRMRRGGPASVTSHVAALKAAKSWKGGIGRATPSAEVGKSNQALAATVVGGLPPSLRGWRFLHAFLP